MGGVQILVVFADVANGSRTVTSVLFQVFGSGYMRTSIDQVRSASCTYVAGCSILMIISCACRSNRIPQPTCSFCR